MRSGGRSPSTERVRILGEAEPLTLTGTPQRSGLRVRVFFALTLCPAASVGVAVAFPCFSTLLARSAPFLNLVFDPSGSVFKEEEANTRKPAWILDVYSQI